MSAIFPRYSAPTVLLLLIAFLLLPSLAVSTAEETQPKVRFTGELVPQTVRMGENARLVIGIALEPTWHIYSVIPSDNPDAPPPTKLKVEESRMRLDGPVYETAPVTEYIPVLGMSIAYHSDRAYLYQNMQPKPGSVPESRELTAQLTYQLCTDTICLPPQTTTLVLPYTISAGEPRTAFLHADRTINPLPEKVPPGLLTDLKTDGFWAFLALAALMGLVSLLTPCVFPMIPITVTYFAKQAEGRQGRVITLASLFALGIIITYTFIGLLMSALFGAGSALQLATNPVVNLIIAIVFIVFAFSLIGLFNISLPAGIESFFDRKARSLGGAAGVLLMGLTFTLTAFTCTVQFVGTMLIAAAQGEWIWPLLGMLVFSTVFALPFFLLAVAPSLIRHLQGRSGAWLGRSKVVLGILELMASVKFLSNADLVWQLDLLSRNTAIVIWTILLGSIVVYLAWTGIRPRLNRSLLQWIIVGVFIILTILVSRGWNGRSLGSLIDAVLPPVSSLQQQSAAMATAEEVEALVWLDSLQQGLEQARQEQKPVFLEFTGYTCVNCRWMEHNIFARREIHDILRQRFVRVRLYTDGGKNAGRNLDLQIKRFQTVALPFYVIISPTDTVIAMHSGMTLQPLTFLKFLQAEQETGL